MKPRPGVSMALAVTVLLGGCADGGTEATLEPVPTDQPEDPADGDAPAPDADRSSDVGAVPPLHPAVDDWDEATVTIRTSEGDTVPVLAKVAATDAQRQRGLMEVEDLPDGVGMLFVFDSERTGGFWMRNTLVPLDIAYLDPDGSIGTILAMDPCEAEEASDCPVYTPDRPYVTALEVPQGWFDRVGVAEGDTVDWSLELG